MSLLHRHRWFVAAVGITLAFAAVSLLTHKSQGLIAFADISALLLLLAAATISLANTLTRLGQERSFWALMTVGLSLWVCNQIGWVHSEIVLHQPIPDPYSFDIILFFHVVPIIAAIAWRPDLVRKEGRVHLSVLNFLMLLGWWTFLYAFLVFPHQYIVLNVSLYDAHYDLLYLFENALLVGVLGLAAWTSSSGWRRLYLHFLGAAVLYGVGSQFLDRAAATGTYY